MPRLVNVFMVLLTFIVITVLPQLLPRLPTYPSGLTFSSGLVDGVIDQINPPL
jgi:hypothetical protein